MLRTLIFIFILSSASLAAAKDLKIVAWNMQAHLVEHVEAKRVTDFQNLDEALKPDVLVVTEVAGEHEARAIATTTTDPHQHCQSWNISQCGGE